MKQLIKEIIKFRNDRDWKQFHTPENLAKSISIEAAEILEHFQWDSTFDPDQLKEELADVFIYLVLMADSIDADLIDSVKKKLELNNQKYPVDKAKGNSKKYTEFEEE
jgi:NTP pyrophosphatase (non-canonical NTP hydrolase)